MLWTLVYIVMTQGGGSLEMQTWPTELRFATQQECTEAANKAAPGLMTGASTYVGPGGGIAGPNPNAVTIRPVCFPKAK